MKLVKSDILEEQRERVTHTLCPRQTGGGRLGACGSSKYVIRNSHCRHCRKALDADRTRTGNVHHKWLQPAHSTGNMITSVHDAAAV